MENHAYSPEKERQKSHKMTPEFQKRSQQCDQLSSDSSSPQTNVNIIVDLNMNISQQIYPNPF